MPLTTASMFCQMQWGLQKTNAGGFAPTTQGADNLPFNLLNVDTTVFNQILVVNYTIAMSGTQTIDLTNQTNLVSEAIDFTEVLTIMVVPTGSQCTLSPGGSSPCTWFFGGSTQSIIIPAGGFFCFSSPAAGPGQTVTSGTKNLLLTNSGSLSMNVDVVILGSTL